MQLQLLAQPIDLFLYVALGGQPPPSVPFSSLRATPPAPSVIGWDPTVIAAVIGAVAAVIAALIAMGVAVYQTRQTRKIEREKDEMQRRHEQEMERFRRELDLQYREKEQEKQQEEAARREMLMAQSNVERAVAYRKALHVDPYLSRMQILDMQRPLEVTNIYVRVRVHEDTVMRYAIDSVLATAAERRDPDSFFQARHHYLEQRSGTAIDPDAAIRKYRRCVIIGDPGAGKTTLLKYLALALADGKYPDLSDLPILIALNAFVSSTDQDMLDYAARLAEEFYAFPRTEARSYMDTMLRDGKAILLLDALDETIVGEQPAQADASYQKAWDAIMRLATRYSEARIVVTARKAGYQQHRQLTGFTVLEIMDFRQEDIRQFVDNWFRCTQGVARATSADDLITRLDRNPRIQALAVNPLLLALIVLVYEAQLDLPDRRAELYRECVEVLLAKWDAKRHIRRRRIFKPDQKRQLLAEVAWHFHQQGRRYFPEQELLTEIAHFLLAIGLSAEGNQQILQEIANENGLLKEQAHSWYGFLHLTLQEYFAAIAITDQSRFTTLVSQCADPWWEEVLLLYTGQTPDASPLLLYLLGEDSTNPRREDLFHTNLLMAGRCLTSFPTVRQKNLREKVIERLFDLFLHTRYSPLRRQIVEVLSAIGGDPITSRLVELVKDVQIDHRGRSDIAWALKRLGRGAVARDLVEMLRDNELDSETRFYTAMALGRLGERSIVPDLIEMLKDNRTDGRVGEGIVQSLGDLGEKSIARDLVGILKDDQINEWVRGGVAWALGDLGEKSVVPDLMGMFKDSRINGKVRGGIGWALGQLEGRSVAPELIAVLKNSQIDDWARGNVAVALGELGERSIVADLMEMLKDSQIDGWVRYRIAMALGKLGEQSVVADLMEMLKDSQIANEVRRGIVWALRLLGKSSVVPDLVEMLKDSQIDDKVRAQILYTLGDLAQDEQTMKACASLLSNPSSIVADAIYSALWDISRRAEVTIIVQNDEGEEMVEFVPWSVR